MLRNQSIVFKNKSGLINLLRQNLSNPTVMKISKGLYLTWGYYAGTYGTLDEYPNYLFDADFTALKYGPTDQEFLKNFDESSEINEIKESDFATSLPDSQKSNVILFIKNLASQLDKIDDFAVMLRTKQDAAYDDVYQDGQQIHMNNEAIATEYVAMINKTH